MRMQRARLIMKKRGKMEQVRVLDPSYSLALSEDPRSELVWALMGDARVRQGGLKHLLD